MQPIARDGVAWSVGWSVCLSVGVCNNCESCKTTEPMEMPFGIWTLVGPGNYILDGFKIPHRKGHFWGVWRQDFPTHHQTPFTVDLTSGFPHMLSTSVPIRQPQK